jgi:hypothetical protein
MNAYVEADGMPVPDQSGDSREKKERSTPRPKEGGLPAIRRSGPPKLEWFREAQPPDGAPTVETARAVWELVSVGLSTVRLPSGQRPRELEDLASSVLRFAIGSTRAAVEDTAKQALTVALDVFICAGRDGKPVYINSVFQGLARRWSSLFRRTPGGSTWNKKPETLTSARTEMLDAGVDLAKVWTAVCDGVEGLYSVSMIGGPDHARGRSVDLEEGAPLEHFDKLILADPDYKRPRGRNRVLPADAATPPRVIDRKTVSEKDYDVVTIGGPTEHVLQLLEGASLFIDVERLRQDVTTLRTAVEEHSLAEDVGRLEARQRPTEGPARRGRDARALDARTPRAPEQGRNGARGAPAHPEAVCLEAPQLEEGIRLAPRPPEAGRLGAGSG